MRCPCIHACTAPPAALGSRMQMPTSTRVRACVCTCACVHAHVHASMLVCARADGGVHACVHMHACVCAHACVDYMCGRVRSSGLCWWLLLPTAATTTTTCLCVSTSCKHGHTHLCVSGGTWVAHVSVSMNAPMCACVCGYVRVGSLHCVHATAAARARSRHTEATLAKCHHWQPGCGRSRPHNYIRCWDQGL